MARFARALLWSVRGLLPAMPRRAVGALVIACVFGLASTAHAQQTLPVDPVSRSDEPLFSIASPVGDIDYVAGRGLRLGRTGLTIGGFTTLEIDKVRHEDGTLELDSLNFLALWQPFDFLRGFSEIEIGNLLAYDMGTGEVFSDADAQIERLYGDLTRSDALNLRIGKFQTPVGIWNLVPAEPFTWTATEPAIVETAFDEHQTGGALFGSLYPTSSTFDYWLYGQFVDPLDPSDDEDPIDRSVGGRVRWGDSLGQWAVGSSFLASEQSGRWNFMGGLDALWRIGALELQGEFAITRGDIPGRDVWGVYVQGVYDIEESIPCLRGLHLVGRYEHFVPGGEARTANIYNVGLTWIPVHFLIFKAGYQFTEGQPDYVDQGLFSSFSILF
jgi:hypothetical protein